MGPWGSPSPSPRIAWPEFEDHSTRLLETIGVWLFSLDGIHRSPVAWRIEALMCWRHMKGPVWLEVAAEVHGSQLQHRFGHGGGPTHPRPLHPILGQVLTRPLHHAGRDRPALAEIRIVAPAVSMPVEGGRRCFHDLALLPPERTLRGTQPHPLHHLAHLAMQRAPGPLLDLGQGFGTACLVEGIGRGPQLREDVLEV